MNVIRSKYLLPIINLISLGAFAAPANFVYQGQIVKPDGMALESNSVIFTLEVISPGAEQCVLYRERHTLNMTGSNGVFALEVGDGSRLPSPNFEDTIKIANVSSCPVIISGGVSSMKDIKKAKELNNKNIEGIIVGKAIYDGDIKLENLVKELDA